MYCVSSNSIYLVFYKPQLLGICLLEVPESSLPSDHGELTRSVRCTVSLPLAQAPEALGTITDGPEILIPLYGIR